MLTSGGEFSIEQLKINLVGGPLQSYNFLEWKTFFFSILIKTNLPSLLIPLYCSTDMKHKIHPYLKAYLLMLTIHLTPYHVTLVVLDKRELLKQFISRLFSNSSP